MDKIRVENNKLVIYDSETNEDLAIIPNNEQQLAGWTDELEHRRVSVLTSVDEQKESDEYHIAYYTRMIEEYNREIVNIVPEVEE